MLHLQAIRVARHVLVLAGVLIVMHPARAAMPILADGLTTDIAEAAQFRGNRGGDIVRPDRGGGLRGPRFPGGLIINPGVFLPPNIREDVPVRRRRSPQIVVEEVDEPAPRRPRRPRGEFRPPPKPVAVRPVPTRRVAPPPPPRPPVVTQPRRPPVPPPRAAQPRPPRVPPISIPRLAEDRLVRDEVLVELRPGVNIAQFLARHRLSEVSTDRFELANAVILRARVDGNRSARTALQQMAGDARVSSAQPNYIYALQQNAPAPAAGAAVSPDQAAPMTAPEKTPEPDASALSTLPASPEKNPDNTSVSAAEPTAPAPGVPPTTPVTGSASVPPRQTQPPPALKPQYVLDKLGVPDAHRIARGKAIKVALIDTGIDERHPELDGVIAGRFDALAPGSENITSHGTAMAGAIVAKSTLQGVSPAAELLVARSFSGSTRTGTGAEGTSFHILKSLDWSYAQGARVLNLSFAGPQDRLLSRALEGARSRKLIAIAAAGNAGPSSAPLYPAADPSVLSVTATDADDKVFVRANAGAHIAIAAPGVDVIAAAPEAAYAFTSGTSIAAAHVSGLVALMLERNSDLDLAQVRAILRDTAQDLGAKGLDPVFGAGRANGAAALARVPEKSGRAP
ncbi:AprE Subtilisin-like serine proteases [Rhabdaerophilaceae bacterium]